MWGIELSQLIQALIGCGFCCCYGYPQWTTRSKFFWGTCAYVGSLFVEGVIFNVAATPLGLPCKYTHLLAALGLRWGGGGSLLSWLSPSKPCVFGSQSWAISVILSHPREKPLIVWACDGFLPRLGSFLFLFPPPAIGLFLCLQSTVFLSSR